ncbi:MAG: hypothetical protein K2X36_04095, partial [Microbacteriaceae bacterium]|nr:hypothetical protein [Microbacteriaceae bacterium]
MFVALLEVAGPKLLEQLVKLDGESFIRFDEVVERAQNLRDAPLLVEGRHLELEIADHLPTDLQEGASDRKS